MKQAGCSEGIKRYQPENNNFASGWWSQPARQYSNVISAATSNRSQIQTHVSKQVHFHLVQQMNNFMEYKMQ